jgi:hypothetical protein
MVSATQMQDYETLLLKQEEKTRPKSCFLGLLKDL